MNLGYKLFGRLERGLARLKAKPDFHRLDQDTSRVKSFGIRADLVFVAFKFPFKNSKIGVVPLASESQVKLAVKREAKMAEANEDWSDKTASNWSEHSGFIEISKGADLAPPPRLDPRTVPRPAPPVHGLSAAEKNLAIGLVLALGMVFGAYQNGLFSRRKHAAPQIVAEDSAPVEPKEESSVAAQPRDVIVPPIAAKNQPVIVPPEAPKSRLPASPVSH